MRLMRQSVRLVCGEIRLQYGISLNRSIRVIFGSIRLVHRIGGIFAALASS